MTAGVTLRWLRALALAGVAMLTGALGHVEAGGLLPGAGALALMLALVTVAAAPLLRREASTIRVVLLLVLAQASIHVALSAVAGHQVSRAASAASAHGTVTAPAAEHVHAQGVLDSTSWTSHLLSELTGANAAMAAVHLIAAALVGAWLAAGERAVWTLIALAACTLLRPWNTVVHAWARLGAPVIDARATTTLLDDDNRRGLRDWLLCRVVTRRGPPVVGSAV